MIHSDLHKGVLFASIFFDAIVSHVLKYQTNPFFTSLSLKVIGMFATRSQNRREGQAAIKAQLPPPTQDIVVYYFEAIVGKQEKKYNVFPQTSSLCVI